MYKRQQSPSWWLPSGPVIPNVTVEHGPGGLCPTQAVSGPHGAPRASSHRDGPETRERARRPRVAALQAAANGQRFARVPHVLAPNATAERRQRRLWPSPRAFSVACGGPHRTDSRLAASWAAERRPSPQRPRNACRLGQARLCVSENISRLRD